MPMYIIAFDGGKTEVTTNIDGVESLTNIFERGKIDFTVSCRSGKLTPQQFGFGYYTYWRQSFD